MRNLGSQPARGCHAYLRLSSGVMTGGDVLEPELGELATADFSVRYDPAVHPGTPVPAWADCTLASPGRGNVSSSRAYLGSLPPAAPGTSGGARGSTGTTGTRT